MSLDHDLCPFLDHLNTAYVFKMSVRLLQDSSIFLVIPLKAHLYLLVSGNSLPYKNASSLPCAFRCCVTIFPRSDAPVGSWVRGYLRGRHTYSLVCVLRLLMMLARKCMSCRGAAIGVMGKREQSMGAGLNSSTLATSLSILPSKESWAVIQDIRKSHDRQVIVLSCF